ncbi:30S ribosomal protein S6 [Candidatus Saccharibacteria bacterium]|nr:MAG: 30S ribosomal protein S6 [Candidatus Saccharibacteria bacterium]PID98910.1 MAG: 30S ribosomal protein S6 [Candidatus Saccharibacteria bacterium]
MKQYEIAILFDPGLEIDLETATKKVESIFTSNGGKITNVDNWGKKKLAYQIQNHDSAVYVFYTLDMPGEAVRKIEYTLNITDEVIRFLIVRPDQKKIAKAEAEKARKAEQAAKRADGEDKEDEK